MGYKMKGFTYPGKSPVKEIYVPNVGAAAASVREKEQEQEGSGGVTIADLDKYYAKLYGDSREAPTLEEKYTEKGVSKREGLPEGTEGYLKSKGEGYNIWKDPKLRKKITDPKAAKELKAAKATEGLVGDEMATSKAEIKQRKTKSKISQKTSGKTDEERGFSKVGKFIRQSEREPKRKLGKWIKKVGKKVIGISGKERAANKLQKLKGKKRLAEATGQLGVKANILSGLQIGPQADKLERRITAKEARIESKKTRKATKK